MLTDFSRQTLAGLRILIVLTVLLGVVYPVAVWAAGRAFADRADGQLLHHDGEVVGSRLLGQNFEGDTWFHPRPSANGYDTLASAPSNLGPSNPDLLAAIEERRAAVAEAEDVDPARVPADALTASGSGLDPHISPAYALLQAGRVAAANGLTPEKVRRLIDAYTEGPVLGFLGVEGVNVVELNLAISRAAH
ncbi:potassium-transporting ATPase subunit KdpC [Nocardioides sp. Bht2]|uniref:potassium-transporting ATPase subunit KdpC n=1 Tax=Nocardioides sp. Bht2 TaxID=3392297 RepID=UPI0039B5B7A6